MPIVVCASNWSWHVITCETKNNIVRYHSHAKHMRVTVNAISIPDLLNRSNRLFWFTFANNYASNKWLRWQWVKNDARKRDPAEWDSEWWRGPAESKWIEGGGGVAKRGVWHEDEIRGGSGKRLERNWIATLKRLKRSIKARKLMKPAKARPTCRIYYNRNSHWIIY